MSHARGPWQGVVDVVADGTIAGWCTAPRVVVSRNGTPLVTLTCDGERPDVAAAGISEDSQVGFHAPLRLTSGDIVRVSAQSGQPLRHSPWCYLADQDHGGLPCSVAMKHPEYAGVAALQDACPFTRFLPLFGRQGLVSAAMLIGDNNPPVVARLEVPKGEAKRLVRLYREVLEPAGVACAGLRVSLVVGNQHVLVYDAATGRSLDRVGTGWETWLPAVTAELERLQAFGATLKPHHRLLYLAGGKPSLIGRLLREALRDSLRPRHGPTERRFLRWLLFTLMRLPRVLSHGDLHRENVMVDPVQERIALIDWDRAGYLPLGFDLALLMRGLPGEAAERLAGGCRLHRLGVAGFTYLFQRLDRADFIGSQEAKELQQRCLALSKR